MGNATASIAQMSIAELNHLDQAAFVRKLGPVFEHSPWFVERTWAKRPFPTVAALHAALCDTVKTAPEAEKLALIRAHPDLVGRFAREGKLSAESAREQAGAGLNELSPEEIARFEKNNAAYRRKFQFPFVICARLNQKAAILAGFEQRLGNSRTQELATALSEIDKIAWLRLRDLVRD